MSAYRLEVVFTKKWPEPRPMAIPKPLKRPPATLQEALATCDRNLLASYLHVLGCSAPQIIAAIEDPTGYGFERITTLRPAAVA